MSDDRKSTMTLVGTLLKGLVEGKFLVVVRKPDGTFDFVTNDKDAVKLAVDFIEVIEKA